MNFVNGKKRIRIRDFPYLYSNKKQIEHQSGLFRGHRMNV